MEEITILEALPLEILSTVVDYCNVLDVLILSQVCRYTYNTIGFVKLDYANACFLASKEGSIVRLEWLSEYYANWNDRCKPLYISIHSTTYILNSISSVVQAAAASVGRVDVLEWMKRKGYSSIEMSNKLASIACGSGSLETVQWLHDDGYTFGRYLLCVSAARCSTISTQSKYLNILQWLVSNGCKLDSGVCEAAASNGCIDIVIWARDIMVKNVGISRMNDYLTFIAAARGGSIAILKYLKEYVTSYDSALAAAISHGRLEVVKWIKSEYKAQLSSHYLETAAHACRLDMIKWLREHGCLYTTKVATEAARHGMLEVLQWIVEDGCPIEDDILGRIFTGSCTTNIPSLLIAVIDWLVSKGYVLTKQVLLYAIDNSQLEVVQWMVEKMIEDGYVFNDDVCMHAVKKRRATIFKWLVVRGFLVTNEVLDNIKQTSQIALLEWLRCEKHIK